MPRTPTVTVEGTVEAIKESDTPVVSTGQLADHFDVTRQAVRDQRERLSSDPRIDTGQIGNNTVFYLSDVPLAEVEETLQDTREVSSDGPTQGRGQHRGVEQIEDGSVDGQGNNQQSRARSDFATFVELMAHQRVTVGALGMVLVSLALAVSATAFVSTPILAVGLSHLGQIIGYVGFGLLILQFFAVLTVRERDDTNPVPASEDATEEVVE